jgi:hypothetical protein
MRFLSIFSTVSLYLSLATATLIVDFQGSDNVSALGKPQLEGQNHGDRIAYPGNASIYIRSDKDSNGTPALHYHRDAHYRRAEVEAKGTYAAGKTYFTGYTFMLERSHQGLAIFQW